MKANELRIGNYVYDTLGKVNKIDLEAITYIVKEPHNQVKPIQLTEEWLLKFGFIKVTYTVSLSDGGMPYHYELEGQGNHWRLYFDGRFFAFNERKLNLHLSHNRYVHQLQNLYFALTGEELILKSE